MPVYRIAVSPVHPVSDEQLIRAAHQLNLTGLKTCYAVRLFFLEGDCSQEDVARIASELLADPVTETFTIGDAAVLTGDHRIEATFLPGVTDPAAESLVRAAHLLGFTGITKAASGQHYTLSGALTPDVLHRLATDIFSNAAIQQYVIDAAITPPFVAAQPADSTVELIAIRGADDAQLLALSAERRLSLDLNEMQAIRAYYEEIGREATDAELEMLAQTWSEHCVHKTFRAKIDYTGPAHGADAHAPASDQHVDGLLRTYIRAATEKLDKDWVRSAFVDNAGIIRFDDQWDIAFKAETHNRPSALEPFGGANTGVGGVIRDVLGVSARPIANTDILCFGLPDAPVESLPQGVLHPSRIAEGVVAGIEDYGNKMGIPTVNGAIVYHEGYTANPLVFCGCVGILPHGSHRSTAEAGDLIVVIGGRTGRDGLRGATFSSMEMDTTSATASGGAVQIGHAIQEKQVLEVVLRARDEGLYTAITDCGAGGLSSAVGEMGAQIGATVQLSEVSLKYPGLRPWEIWLSEAQERMVLAIPPQNWARLQAIAQTQDVEAIAIGTFEPTGNLTLRYGDVQVGELSMDFLHDGIPTRHMQAVWTPPTFANAPVVVEDEAFNETLLQLLALPTIRSKEDVIRKYDHEVQTGTAVKPLVGEEAAGAGNASVIVPLDTLLTNATTETDTTRGFALSNGVCPTYTAYDPYAMAWAAVDEAMRNLVAVGADPDQVAILDNFSWGNTQLPDRLGSLVRCSQGCYDAALAYGVPFISGKDSLNNEYLGADGERHSIPGTLVISAVGIVPDVAHTVTMDAKTAGNTLYLVGETRAELGGSHYHLLHNIEGGTVPQPNADSLETLRALHAAIRAGYVQACHDLSEGGLAVALAEMSIAGGLGIKATLPTADTVSGLFAESTGRFIVEVKPEDQAAFIELLPQAAVLGEVTADAALVIYAADAAPVVETSVDALAKAWRGHVSATESAKTAAAPVADVPARETLLVSGVAEIVKAPRVLILHANGTNRDRDAYLACQLAGGAPEIVHVNQLINGDRRLLDYHMLVVPGGFSYGDDLGAGVLWSLDLRERLPEIGQFVEEGRPVLGICNGFQTLVKSGLLPGDTGANKRKVTLTYNQQGRFECRWVYLQPNENSPCLFTQGLVDLIHCPIAHGEGQVAVEDATTLEGLLSQNLNALTYVDASGNPAGYPVNPNGSAADIAGLCNPAGNVFGLMPHPENHIFPWQNPRYHRGANGLMGLRLFENGIKRS